MSEDERDLGCGGDLIDLGLGHRGEVVDTEGLSEDRGNRHDRIDDCESRPDVVLAQHGLDDTVHLRQALRSQELTAVDDVDVGESGGIGKGIAECRGGLGRVAVGWEERLVTGLGAMRVLP